MIPLFIPSPPINGFGIGPVFVRFYAVCILAAILFAWWLSGRRWKARGGRPEAMETVVVWTVPLGILGARIYHVATHIEDYFGPGRNPLTVFYIWEGGLGIMGGVALGAVGAWIAARRLKVPLATIADVLAPGIVFAQAIGRLGNYFNQELFGGPTTLPWGLEIAPAYRPLGFEQYATFHPTFLYEMLWDIAVGFLLLWLDRRFAMGRGKLFFSYMALYSLGRLGTESLRIDPADLIFGIRNHQFIVGCLFVFALIMLVWLFRYRPGRDPDLFAPAEPAEDSDATAPVESAPSTEDIPSDTTDGLATPVEPGGNVSLSDAPSTGAGEPDPSLPPPGTVPEAET